MERRECPSRVLRLSTTLTSLLSHSDRRQRDGYIMFADCTAFPLCTDEPLSVFALPSASGFILLPSLNYTALYSSFPFSTLSTMSNSTAHLPLDAPPNSESFDEYFTLPQGSVRHSASVRSITTHTHTHMSSAQSAILENTEGEATDDIIDTCPPTPRDPFMTPAHSPVPSAPGSTHNLGFVQLAGATASRLSIHSPVYGFASLANGQGVSATQGNRKAGPSSETSSSSPPPVPPLPSSHGRGPRVSGSVEFAATTTNTPTHIKRESFAAPPKLARPPSAISIGSHQRRLSQRPGTAGTHGSSIHLTPPGSAHSLSEKAALGIAFQRNEERYKSCPPKRQECKMLEPDAVIEKPWLMKPDRRARMAYWLTVLFSTFGIVASFLRTWYGAQTVQLLKGNLCMVLEDDFDGNSIDTSKWSWDVAMDGFGNGEFEMMTNSPNNSFVEDGILYIVPTLTSDVIGSNAIFDGFTFNITGCTVANSSACGAVSNQTTKTVINPVQSARLTTVNSTSIQYGKIEIRAKISTGDWLWPAIWMLPVDNTYGPWPLSGEIDIMESRGNDRRYLAQGVDFVRASLNWGPLSWLNEGFRTFGFWEARRSTFNEDFHTYTLEWSDKFIRSYVDSRLHLMLDLTFDRPFFNRGQFPPTVFNGTSEIPVPNPWGEDSFSAPFDQAFYLIMNVAVGGTNGWFPDNVGDKPWLDQSDSAMYDFAKSQGQWYSTWPTDVKQRGMAVDYVKMWQLC
ncbi:putative member of glycoside hydrolase family GH16 [Sanghuangporus baumii]|uniref:Member of glycoside hydrolase family GH16 n=1 Tax=Sanghuangporus baumii TaxID=108892 RepID=A0A9Q5I0W6_SANBA|nr:putative member of glycoside hydrolase family GH16 [Sanghuangporus baumii]